MNTFDNIKALAAEQGITIKRLAEKAGIGENSIYRWKKTNPSTKSLEKVAKVLNVEVSDLLAKDDKTLELQAIQRKAKKLSSDDRKKLLQLIDLTFDIKK
ncbi:helix-turn-helix domain-containing protein [Ligilactobacillus salivarius]|uniref:helix-turn-helix domain-containing protein n=1 Tax=Ligilactobacillus salivarius TaxID=1624 RepID=UPI0022E4CBC3|nr:helix-turn-helix transcriptional regulator [Ligilactobacillus salivarius]